MSLGSDLTFLIRMPPIWMAIKMRRWAIANDLLARIDGKATGKVIYGRFR